MSIKNQLPPNSTHFQINIFFDFVDSKKIDILVLSGSDPLEYGRVNLRFKMSAMTFSVTVLRPC